MFELSDREFEELWPGLERLLNNTGRPWDALDVEAARQRERRIRSQRLAEYRAAVPAAGRRAGSRAAGGRVPDNVERVS